MRGTNRWSGSGNVGNPIVYGETGDGVKACSFMVAVDSKVDTTWVRINAYAGLVEVCKNKGLRVGSYVIVEGELMNRVEAVRKKSVVEVRATNVVIVTKKSED